MALSVSAKCGGWIYKEWRKGDCVRCECRDLGLRVGFFDIAELNP